MFQMNKYFYVNQNPKAIVQYTLIRCVHFKIEYID